MIKRQSQMNLELASHNGDDDIEDSVNEEIKNNNLDENSHL
jgi:hypothetical protein